MYHPAATGRGINMNITSPKVRFKKRKDKEIRRMGKMDQGKHGVDKVIAYFDGIGVATSELPKHDNIQKVDMEEIAVSTPKKQNEENVLSKWRAELILKDKDYCFIKVTDSAEKYFFHLTDPTPEIAGGTVISFEFTMLTAA